MGGAEDRQMKAAKPADALMDPNERMPRLRAVGRALVRILPRNEILFRVARKIVDHYNGDNDFDYRTNGEMWLARTALPRARVVFDVGANQGDWAILAHDVNPKAVIHCFEPSAATHRLLVQRAPFAIVNDFGLGDRDAELTLWVFSEGAVSNSLYHRVGTIAEPQGTETVRVQTLDGYCAARGIEAIDFLKIDVEGHELAVFRGAERMFREARIGAVQFEYNDTFIDSRTQLKDIWQFILETTDGYGFYKIYPRQLRHIPEYKQTYESFRYSNWAVLRRDVAEAMGVPA
jgi:FkbM family methyltransferase